MQQYIVRKNDTMFLIARRFGIPLSFLIQANPQIDNPNQLQVGDIIFIPEMQEIPSQLTNIEKDSISMMDDIYQGKWAAAQEKLDQININLEEVLPILEEATVPQSSISGLKQVLNRLQSYVNQRRVYPSIAQANLITGYLPDILDHFKTPVPTDFWRLYYLARAIIINIENNDWNEARNNYQRAVGVWERLRARTPVTHRTQITEMNQIFESLNQSIMAENYLMAINDANKMLDKASELEKLFI